MESENQTSPPAGEATMQVPLKISAPDVALTEAHQALIRDYANKLETFFNRVTACKVTVTAPNHWGMGSPVVYNVQIDLTVPGAELVVKRQPHSDLLEAIQEAFRAAGRQLQDHARKLRDELEDLEASPRAKVIRLFPYEGYGFLETPDGREIYFHRNSVLNGGFERLEVGMGVRFAEEEGEKGPQASTVAISGGHRSKKTQET
jgi:cold shock CspA family protein/ribosome-associated translation inhibitor RaiA